MRASGLTLLVMAAALAADPVLAQYQLPPKEIVDILDAPPLPTASVKVASSEACWRASSST